jgi:excinuclease ABC subunit C
MEDLTGQIALVARKPGVYLWRDSRGKILYVGKSDSLRDRLRSYLKPADRKTRSLMANAVGFEVILAGNEVEALILEDALIKQHQPRYNVLLRDDKRYPYIKVTVGERFPRIMVSRRVEADGSRYFGPYVDAGAVRRMIRFVGRYFGVRACNHSLSRVSRPCIQYRMGNCSAPCSIVDEAGYEVRVGNACRFLKGERGALVRDLKKRIGHHSRRLEYESARDLKEVLDALESLSMKHCLSGSRLQDMDVLGYAHYGGKANVCQIRIRGGVVVAVLHHRLKGRYLDDAGVSLKAFICQHYTTGDIMPKIIATSSRPSDKLMLEERLSGIKGSRVGLRTPLRGQNLRLVQMASDNSMHHLQQEALKGERRKPLEMLRDLFGLKDIPERIEGFDISNIGGKHTVGAMVVYTNGMPDKRQYRRFKIIGEGQDDPLNMADMIGRRFGHDEWSSPDIVLVDGGRPQISACKKHMPEGVFLLGLAKKEELIYLPGRKAPIRLSGDNPALNLLKAVRDEAHRFGKKYHTLRRKKDFIKE